ncbi:MAG: hypothetical protein KIT73_20735, partial [Burkholderiales bacterium]|nr:hypothetical protein [Burkholderiales bacterium]
MGRTAALICSAAVAPWLIALAVALAYANAFGGGFQFDDFNVIVDNPTVHSWAAWWSRMPGLRPLLKLTYTANWVSGFGVAGFHAVNILLHLANALLVFAISRPVLMDAGLAPDLAARVALPAALLFALHPAQTEAVTYVSGRSVSLMALFYLVAIACHLRARVDGGAIPWRAGALAAFVLAFAAKEVAWTLPLAIVLIELQRNSGAWRPTLRATRPYLIVLAVVGVAAFFVPGYWRLLMSSFDTRSLAANLLTQIAGQYHLLAEPLLTLRLNVDPDLPVREAWSADLALKAAVLVGLIAIAVLQWRQRRWIALGIFWFFVHLAATNTVLPRYDVANDRQLYLALIGPAWIIATA